MKDNNSLTHALACIIAERELQDRKWGKQDHDPFTYITVLGEEFGELCEAALHTRFGGPKAAGLRDEAVQIAAVAVAIVECLDRGKWSWEKGGQKTRHILWRDLECEDAPTFAGYLEGQPGTSLFILTDVNEGECVLRGAFIPDEDDSEIHPSRLSAELSAASHLERWMTRNF